MTRLYDFLAGYIECALWSSTDQSTQSGGCPLDDNYGADDIDTSALDSIRAECADFIEHNKADLDAYIEALGAESAGHDFWLTRNGHGAGFWDRGLGALGDRLTTASKPYGEVYLYVGDDGKLYV